MPMKNLVALLRRPLALVVVLAAVTAVAAAGCGGGGTESRVAAPVSAQALSESAQASAEETSAEFTFSMTMTAPGFGEAVSFSGSGAFDSANETASMKFDMSSFAQLMDGLGGVVGGPDLGNADDWKIEIVQAGGIIYMKFPLLSSQIPGGKPWVKIDAAKAAKLQGFDLEQLKQFESNDPRELLKFLEAVGGEIETVGTEDIGGVTTTHYRGVIDLGKFAALFPPNKRDAAASMFDSLLQQSGLGAIPVDVWLDDEQRVRRFELFMSATQPGTNESFEATMTMDISGYGRDVQVELPPADQVADVSEFIPQTP